MLIVPRNAPPHAALSRRAHPCSAPKGLQEPLHHPYEAVQRTGNSDIFGPQMACSQRYDGYG